MVSFDPYGFTENGFFTIRRIYIKKKDNLLLTSYSNETPEINTTLIKRGTDKQIILLDGQKDVF